MQTPSEGLKTCFDTFGRISFVLESIAKLSQTGDHPEVLSALCAALIKDVAKFQDDVKFLTPTSNE